MAGIQQNSESLHAAIAELTEAVTLLRQSLAVHNAEQKPLEEMVKNHEMTLYGDKKNNSSGLVGDVTSVKSTLASLDKALWIVLTPFLTGIGVGIIYLIVMVSK